MYPATIPGAMTKKIAEPAMASIRLIAEDSKSPLAMAGNLEVWHVWNSDGASSPMHSSRLLEKEFVAVRPVIFIQG